MCVCVCVLAAGLTPFLYCPGCRTHQTKPGFLGFLPSEECISKGKGTMWPGHTSIQVQQWPVNVPVRASRAGIIKISSVYTGSGRRGRGVDPMPGESIFPTSSGLHSLSEGAPDAGDDNAGPLFLALASSLSTFKQADKPKALEDPFPLPDLSHAAPKKVPSLSPPQPASAAAQVHCCHRLGQHQRTKRRK